MSKLNKLLTGLKRSRPILATLDQAGIDVDKLLRINKAPGPVRDILHAFILDAGQHISSDRTGELPTLREGLVFKPVKSSRLRK